MHSWGSSEWAWLHGFSTTVKTAEALARGHTFPESFSVPDLEPVAKDKMALLMVSGLNVLYTMLINSHLKVVSWSAVSVSELHELDK